MKILSILLFFVLTSQWIWCQSSQITVAYQFANIRGKASGFEIGMKKQIKPRSWVGARFTQITDRSHNTFFYGNRVRPYYQVQIGRAYQFLRLGKAFSANIEAGLSGFLNISGNQNYWNCNTCDIGYVPNLWNRQTKIRPGAYSRLGLQYVLTKRLAIRTETALNVFPGRKNDIGWLNTYAWQIGLGYEWN
jgi:hypothetical protein